MCFLIPCICIVTRETKFPLSIFIIPVHYLKKYIDRVPTFNLATYSYFTILVTALITPDVFYVKWIKSSSHNSRTINMLFATKTGNSVCCYKTSYLEPFSHCSFGAINVNTCLHYIDYSMPGCTWDWRAPSFTGNGRVHALNCLNKLNHLIILWYYLVHAEHFCLF